MSDTTITVQRITDLLVMGIATATGVVPLREPIRISPDLSDNLVTFEYRPLRIVAYGGHARRRRPPSTRS
jgi:hypothetical protein